MYHHLLSKCMIATMGQLPHHEQKLVADILQSCQPDIVIHYIDVQKQANTSDCGLFSIAFATALTYGQDPAMIYFDQEKMRQHVINCMLWNWTRHCSKPMVTKTHSKTPQKPFLFIAFAVSSLKAPWYNVSPVKNGFAASICIRESW